jgi:hypothetical protein
MIHAGAYFFEIVAENPFRHLLVNSLWLKMMCPDVQCETAITKVVNPPSAP